MIEEEEEDIIWKIMMRRMMRLFPCDLSGAARRPLRHLGQVRDARAAHRLGRARAIPDKSKQTSCAPVLSYALLGPVLSYVLLGPG